ncbi:lipopolysaccharide biosynthesis protein [Marivirga sp.]|uniref:lipopolysaccharide biosynthesis protein n=1 Tax=Marivirga sp. TaxID=2018662 RepID=UPI003DA72B10
MKNIKSTFLLLFGNIFSQGLPFLLQPFLTRVLSPEDYGYIFIFQLIAVVLVPITHLSYSICLEKSYFDFSEHKLKLLRSTALLTSFVLSILWFAIIFFTIEVLKVDFTIPPKYVYLGCAFSLLETFFVYGMSHFKIREKFKSLVFLQIILVIIDFSLTLVFILILELGWEGRVYAKLIAWALLVTFIIIYFYSKNLFEFKLNKESFTYLNKFSLPLVPHALNTVIIAVSDRFFLSWLESPKALGLYSVGYQWGLIITTVGLAINKVWISTAYKRLNLNTHESSSGFVKDFYIYSAFIMLLAISLALSSDFLIKLLLGGEFHSASTFVNFTSFAYAFNSIYLLLTPIYYVASKNKVLLKISMSVALINIILNYFLISLNGAIGAAQATLISFSLKFFLTWMIAIKINKMPWRLN